MLTESVRTESVLTDFVRTESVLTDSSAEALGGLPSVRLALGVAASAAPRAQAAAQPSSTGVRPHALMAGASSARPSGAQIGSFTNVSGDQWRDGVHVDTDRQLGDSV